MNQKQKTLFNNYKNASTRTLAEIYKNCSFAKQNAYNKILQKAVADGGYDVRCFNSNTCQFSMAYLTKVKNKEFLHYFTKCNNFVFCID